MSPVWILPNRYYYCSLCRQWYGGGAGELLKVPNPNQDRIDEASSTIADPILEEDEPIIREPDGGPNEGQENPDQA
jgi:hypothetical protein